MLQLTGSRASFIIAGLPQVVKFINGANATVVQDVRTNEIVLQSDGPLRVRDRERIIKMVRGFDLQIEAPYPRKPVGKAMKAARVRMGAG